MWLRDEEGCDVTLLGVWVGGLSGGMRGMQTMVGSVGSHIGGHCGRWRANRGGLRGCVDG